MKKIFFVILIVLQVNNLIASTNDSKIITLFNYSDIVFNGKAIKKEYFYIKGNCYEFDSINIVRLMRVTFAVEHIYKGKSKSDIICIFQNDDASGSNGRYFNIGENYIIYAKFKKSFDFLKENFPDEYRKFLYTTMHYMSELPFKEELQIIDELSKKQRINRKYKKSHQTLRKKIISSKINYILYKPYCFWI